jgi:hypothetical protein
MTAKTRYVVICSALVMFVGVGSGLVAYYGGLPARAFASHGGPDELQYIPYDATVVAYADVRHIMASELRQRILRAKPVQASGQHEFENQTGINIETDIDHVVACLQADAGSGKPMKAGLVLARGTFNEVKIEALMREHGAQVEPYKDKRLIVAAAHAAASVNPPSADDLATSEQLAVAFLKPGLAAIGTPALVRRAIDLENGGDSIVTNEEVVGLVRSLDSGNVWAVGRLDALRASAKLPAGMGQLPAISWFSATATIDDGINGTVRAETSSDEAAKNLRDIIQGVVALASLQTASKPELKALTQSLEISGSGKTVALSFSLPGRIVDLMTPATAKPRDSRAH